MSFFGTLSSASNLRIGVSAPTINPATSDVVMVFDGDSLTLGEGAGDGQYYPNKVNTNFANTFQSKEFYSYGKGGQDLLDMMADASTQIYPKATVGKENILVVWEEANAILKVTGSGSVKRTAVQNYNDMITYIQDGKDAGFQHCILITGYMPRKSPSGNYEISTLTITPESVDEMEVYCNMVTNADINTVPWDYHIDLRNAPNIGGAKGQQEDALYFKDYLHLLAAGYDEIATVVIAKINSIFGI